MRPMTFDVSNAGDGASQLQQSGWLFSPPADVKAKGVLICLSGGSYDKRYWHMEIPGHSNYSFAEYMAERGYCVVVVDHIAVGDSTVPPTGELDLMLLAKGNSEVARHVRERVRNGTLSPGLRADAPVFGVGHSMGGCIAAVVQAEAKSYSGLVVLGFGLKTIAQELVGLTLEASRAVRRESLRRITSHGFDDDARFADIARDQRRQLFYNDDVPEAVVAADTATNVPLPLPVGYEVSIPALIEPFIARVDVPVFLGYGEYRDISSHPRAEPVLYSNSPDITVMMLPGSGHCHNFAANRDVLWERISLWLDASRLQSRAMAEA
jgi:alpha-beta hydrolase superfamily lysophospholipase